MFFLIDPELDFSKALVSFILGHWGRATFHVRTIAFYMKYMPRLHGSEGLPTGSSICTPGIHLIRCVPTLGSVRQVVGTPSIPAELTKEPSLTNLIRWMGQAFLLFPLFYNDQHWGPSGVTWLAQDHVASALELRIDVVSLGLDPVILPSPMMPFKE